MRPTLCCVPVLLFYTCYPRTAGAAAGLHLALQGFMGCSSLLAFFPLTALSISSLEQGLAFCLLLRVAFSLSPGVRLLMLYLKLNVSRVKTPQVVAMYVPMGVSSKLPCCRKLLTFSSAATIGSCTQWELTKKEPEGFSNLVSHNKLKLLPVTKISHSASSQACLVGELG